MARKKGGSRAVPAQEPKRLRKQLHKAEAGLHKAEAKRDKAQARVDAFGIIADEIRAQLADLEKASAKEAAAPKEQAETQAGGKAADGDGVEPAPEAAPRQNGGPTPPRPPRRARKTQPAV
jgi:hypothetical protein